MKLDITPMNMLRDFMVIIAVVTAAGGVAHSAGWIVNRAAANTMIAQSVNQEALDRERADLQFQIEMASMKLRLLSDKPERSEYDNMEMSLLIEQVKRLQQRLEMLDGVQGSS